MPSFDHDFLVHLFRSDGKLAVELLRACAGYEIDHERVELGSIDLSQVVPTEYRADAVAILHDRDGRPVAGVIIEVQRRIDRDKLMAWPVYVTGLRAKLGCSAVLLVVAPEPRVAAWARKPIDLGHPGFSLTPMVIELGDVPRISELSSASRLPELAVLSTLAHPELEIARVAINALTKLPEDQARLYSEAIISAVPAAFRQLLEVQMQREEYWRAVAEKYFAKKARIETMRLAVTTLATRKLGEVPRQDLAVLDEVTDLALLTDIVIALGDARSMVEAYMALEPARQLVAEERNRSK